MTMIGINGNRVKVVPNSSNILVLLDSTIKYSKINLDGISNASPPEMVNATSINEKLSEINGNLIDLNAKLEGKNIV